MSKFNFMMEALTKVAKDNGLDTSAVKKVAGGMKKSEAVACLKKVVDKATAEENTSLADAIKLTLAALDCCCKEDDCELDSMIVAKLAPFCTSEAPASAKAGPKVSTPASASTVNTLGVAGGTDASMTAFSQSADMGGSMKYFSSQDLSNAMDVALPK